MDCWLTQDLQRLSQWLLVRTVRLQASAAVFLVPHELVHILALLRSIGIRLARGSTPMRSHLGCVRHDWPCVCVRGLSTGFERLSYLLRQPLLGYWATHRRWYPVRSARSPRPVVLPYRLRNPMGRLTHALLPSSKIPKLTFYLSLLAGLAHPAAHHHLVCA